MIHRPLLVYFGGKFRLRNWIVGHFPEHNVYCEPFGGGGSVLLSKPRSKREVYNDLNGEIVNVFKVMRDQYDELKRVLDLTPYARAEVILSNLPTNDAIERARRTIVRSHMSRGNSFVGSNGLRTSKKSSHSPERTWVSWLENTKQFTDRLQGVLLECRDAIDLIKEYDAPDVLFYLDPPYLSETRDGGTKHTYDKEMLTRDKHEKLLNLILTINGMAIVSAYPNHLYDGILQSWQKVSCQTKKQNNKPSIEMLYINPSASIQNELFLQKKWNEC